MPLHWFTNFFKIRNGQLKVRILALATNFRLDLKGLVETNALAYFVTAPVTKKKIKATVISLHKRLFLSTDEDTK